MKGADEALRTFIHGELLPTFLMADCPTRLNILTNFEAHLVARCETPKLLASERAAEWKTQLYLRLERTLEDWDRLGVPRPFVVSDVENIVVSWRHPRYPDYIDQDDSISHEFCNIYGRIRAATSKEFLIIGAIYLHLMGCAEIYFTDGSGDEGVDLLGVIRKGNFRSVAIAVQAKTGSGLITRNTVFAEYAKYLSLPHTEKYAEYRQALKVDRHVDGISWVYCFMSNCEFDAGARKAASRLGILLRSGRQIAHAVALRLDEVALAGKVSELAEIVRADLQRNIAMLL